MGNKKSVDRWVWIVIAVVAVAVGAYFLLTGNGVGGIPTPPALPE